jgi:hypothetical protein
MIFAAPFRGPGAHSSTSGFINRYNGVEDIGPADKFLRSVRSVLQIMRLETATYVLTVPGCKDIARMFGYLLANCFVCKTLASLEWPYRAQTEKLFFQFISEKIIPSFVQVWRTFAGHVHDTHTSLFGYLCCLLEYRD